MEHSSELLRSRSIKEIVAFLKENASLLRQKQVIAGFDGFVDMIVKPVKIFDSAGNHQFFGTIEEFGTFIAAHAHKSTSIQYKTMEKKPGGNVANLVKALNALGIGSTAIGMFSAENGSIDPLFADLGKERHSFFRSGAATVLEFEDGKVFLSSADISGLDNGEKAITLIENAFSGFENAVLSSDLTAFLNWSELPFAHNLWNDIYLKYLSAAKADKTRVVFFDLCDTAAKNTTEIKALVDLIKKTGEIRKTILSLNKNEAADIIKKLGENDDTAEKAAQYLHRCFTLDELVIHQHTESIALSCDGVIAINPCMINNNPKISTGAGDHFNAAYCCGSLAGLTLAEKLKFANAYAAAYITKGYSPRLHEIDC